MTGRVVVTANEGLRGGKAIPLKQTVDRAVDGLPVECVLVARRTAKECRLEVIDQGLRVATGDVKSLFDQTRQTTARHHDHAVMLMQDLRFAPRAIGGGPTREMLENIETLSRFPGAPRVRCGTVREFLERVEARVADELPVWNGEFYLELHRGTLTSQARNKWHNRKSEFLLHDAATIEDYVGLIGHAVFSQPIGNLSLGARVNSCLRAAGISTIGPTDRA